MSTDTSNGPKSPVVALVSLLPAPTLGVLFGMLWFPGSFAGRTLFAACKIWVLAFPAAWHLLVLRRKAGWSPPLHGGLSVGAALGAAISLVIVGGYALIGRQMIDLNAFRTSLEQVGLADPKVYLIGSAYWVFINALLEEYVWRWFVVRQFEQLVPEAAAVVLSALAFTVHHVVAMSLYLPWVVTIVASAGIFVGAAAWSWCYVRYRSIWPGYISHAIVDMAVFGIGWVILFE